MIKVQPHCEYYLCNFPTGECQGMCQKAAEDDDDIQDYKKPWVGLTDDDIAQAMFKADAIITGPMQFKFAREIEAKLKEKNT
jgi:hypothetical protein